MSCRTSNVFSPEPGFRKFHVVIHVKGRKLPIVQDLIERGQMANVFHQGILLRGVLVASDLGRHVTQGGSILWQENDRQGLLVEGNGLSVPLVCHLDLCQPGKRPIVVRIVVPASWYDASASVRLPRQNYSFPNCHCTQAICS